MKNLAMHTLWTLLDFIVTHGGVAGFDRKELESQVGVTLRSLEQNEYVVFYRTDAPLRLDGDTVIGNIDYRQFKSGQKPPFIVLNELSGTCWTVKRIEEQVGLLSFPLPPNNPVPNAKIFRDVRIKGHQVSMGFKYGSPDCLNSISVQF